MYYSLRSDGETSHDETCGTNLLVVNSIRLSLYHNNGVNHLKCWNLCLLVQMGGRSRSGYSGLVHLLLPSVCLLLERRTSLKKPTREQGASLNLHRIGMLPNEQKDFSE